MKGNKGITLIALVVTIIVLLILAGVAIMMLRGDNGILNRASEAKYENIISGVDEQIRLTFLNLRTHITTNMVNSEDYIATGGPTAESGTKGQEGYVPADYSKGSFDELVDEVVNELGATKITEASASKKMNVEGFTVKSYLDKGSDTKNGHGYILISYSDNALRSSLPANDITNASTGTWKSGSITLTKATTRSSYSVNEGTVAYIIKITNFNCELSKMILTDTTTVEVNLGYHDSEDADNSKTGITDFEAAAAKLFDTIKDTTFNKAAY